MCSIQVSNQWLKVWPIIHRRPPKHAARQNPSPHQIYFIAALSASGCWRQLAPSAILIQHTSTQRRAKSSFPSWHQSHTSSIHTHVILYNSSQLRLPQLNPPLQPDPGANFQKQKSSQTAANQRHLAVNPQSHAQCRSISAKHFHFHCQSWRVVLAHSDRMKSPAAILFFENDVTLPSCRVMWERLVPLHSTYYDLLHLAFSLQLSLSQSQAEDAAHPLHGSFRAIPRRSRPSKTFNPIINTLI